MVIKGEQDLSFVLTALSGPALIQLILSTAHLDWTANHKGHLLCMMCMCVCVSATAGACVFEGVCTPDF